MALSTDGQYRRILFVRTDRLGETLLNLPAVAALREALPQASIALLVNPQLQRLMSYVPGVQEVVACPQGSRGFWWVRALRLGGVLRRRRFDLVIISNPVKELHLAVWLAGIPVRVGYNRKWGRLLTHRLEDRKALGDRHEVEYNHDLIKALGFTVPIPQRIELRCGAEEPIVLQLLEQQGIKPSEPFMAVHPWSSNRCKEWPVDRYREIIQFAIQEYGIHVVVIGGEEERARSQEVTSSNDRVVDLVGRVTLTQLAAVLQRARLLLSNDSGPVHLAAAVGTPTLVLFGTPDPATGPQRWGPWGSGHAVIRKPSMEAISVQDVVAALKRHLASDKTVGARPTNRADP